MGRRLLRFGLAAIALLAVLGGSFAAWLRSDDARHRFERLASRQLGREVRICAMTVGWGNVSLRGLTLADPWSDAPALTVEEGRFDVDVGALLDGGLTGTLRAESFSLDVRKRGEETNLHGIRRPRPSGRALDLSLVLAGGDVRLHDEDLDETVSLEDVSLTGRVQRADRQPVVTLTAAAAAVRGRGVEVHDVSVVLGLDEEGVELGTLGLRIGEGVIEGEARLRFDADSSWSASLEARDLLLRDELLPLVVAVFPAAVGVRDAPEGRTRGTLSLRADVRGAGLSTRALDGRASVWLDDVVLPRETALVRMAALLGRPPAPLAFDSLEVDASLHGSWVTVEGLWSEGEPVPLPFEGRVALDGRLDLGVDVLPLLNVVPGAHGWVRRYTTAVPLRLEGTTEDPNIRPPSAGTVTRALAGAWAERVLD